MSSPTPSTYSNSSDYFLREFPAVGKKHKRSHLVPNFRWTNEITIALLETIILEKHNFEQPSARVYYMNLVTKYPKLSSLQWSKIKHKMRNLKVQYLKATKWRSENSTDLNEDAIKENILTICPFWDYTHQIYQYKIKKNTSKNTELLSDSDNNTSIDSIELSRNEYKHPKAPKILKSPQIFFIDNRTRKGSSKANSNTKKLGSNLSESRFGSEDNVEALNETGNYPPFENHFVNIDKPNLNENSYLEERQVEPELEFQREKLHANREIEKEKLQIQRESIRLDYEKLELEKSKLELEKHKIDVDFKLKLEQIASEERIRKYEIELKHKTSPTPSTCSNSSDYFLREFPPIGKKCKRPHLAHFRWQDETTEAVLDSVILEIHSFEKPTAERFYKNLIQKYPKLSSLDWLKIKSKLRHLKLQYIKAVKWEEENRTNLSNDKIKKHILNICPLWDHCHQIFQNKIKPISVLSDNTSVDSLEFSASEYKQPKTPQTKVFFIDNKTNRQHFQEESNQKKVESDFGKELGNSLDALSNRIEDFRPPFENHFIINPEKSSSNYYVDECRVEAEVELPREKFNTNEELKKSKFHVQTEFIRLENRKLKLEESKLELEKHKIDVDFKLKLEQIASEERIRKYEIEFKYKS